MALHMLLRLKELLACFATQFTRTSISSAHVRVWHFRNRSCTRIMHTQSTLQSGHVLWLGCCCSSGIFGGCMFLQRPEQHVFSAWITPFQNIAQPHLPQSVQQPKTRKFLAAFLVQLRSRPRLCSHNLSPVRDNLSWLASNAALHSTVLKGAGPLRGVPRCVSHACAPATALLRDLDKESTERPTDSLAPADPALYVFVALASIRPPNLSSLCASTVHQSGPTLLLFLSLAFLLSIGGHHGFALTAGTRWGTKWTPWPTQTTIKVNWHPIHVSPTRGRRAQHQVNPVPITGSQ